MNNNLVTKATEEEGEIKYTNNPMKPQGKEEEEGFVNKALRIATGAKRKNISDADLLVAGLKEFSEKESDDKTLDSNFKLLLTEDNKSLNKLTNFYRTVKTIKGITQTVGYIDDNIAILRDIINNLYILANNKKEDNKTELLKLTSEAKTVMQNIVNATEKVSTTANADLKLLKDAADKALLNTKLEQEVQDFNDYESNDDAKLKTLYTKRGISNKSTLKTIEEPPRAKKGGTPYKTAKKQIDTMMSYMSDMMPKRKTQKKHRKHRKH